jgi:hypothetical protein
MPTGVVTSILFQGNFYTMLTFVLLSLLSVILLLLWLQTGKRNKQGRLRTAAFMRHIPSHARWSRWNTAPATLLACCKAARGDRSVVEKWISATQQQSMPPLDRDSAIAELARACRPAVAEYGSRLPARPLAARICSAA